jgi:NDP-sugar pyrophosphorylase family protein
MMLRHPPEGDRFTSVWFEGRRVTAIGERGPGEALMFAGVHALTPRVFDLLPDREFSGITEDFYVPLLHEGSRAVAGKVHDGLWFDVGSPARYLSASCELTGALVAGGIAIPRGSHAMPEVASIAADDCRIWGDVSNSVVGPGSIVEAGADVSDSALWNDVRVHADCRVRSSILTSGVALPPGSVASNAMICLDGGRLVVVPVDPAKPAAASIPGALDYGA